MSTPFIIAIIIGSAVLGLVVFVFVLAYVRSRRLDNLPPRPALRCPSCKSEQIDIRTSGLWDGEDASGSATHGIFDYGVCKQCGNRCARYEDDKPYIPTEEEWQRHFKPIEKWERQAKIWPFEERP
jgi:hypothetical protein